MKTINPAVEAQSYEQVQRLSSPSLRSLRRLLRTQTLFNSAFFIIGSLEIALFISFFALLSKSTVLAFSLALFFLTLFSYFVLRLYLQAKKPDQLVHLCEEYLNRCREKIRYQEGIPEHHMTLANAAQKFASSLDEMEYTVYSPPFFFQSLAPTLEKFSCFSHWKDFHQLREMLLNTSIEEHVKVVKCEPTNLEVHAALANAYVMLSTLYSDPRTFDSEKWIHPESYSEEMAMRFREIANLAIEEFKILNTYAPDDPWVHIQLAYSYHDLQMPEEEIAEYEKVLHLRPNDKDTLFKLGTLYFRQGQNAKGLQVYESLRKMNYSKAETLINFYGN